MTTAGLVVPGHSLGPLCLGASLYDVLTLAKEDRQTYPAIDLHYSPTTPLATPVIVNLPANGLRLRFDGTDQRLRLIEVLDFQKTKLIYKGSDLVRPSDGSASAAGRAFQRVYSIFGPSYPGEYLAPKQQQKSRRESRATASGTGTYVLSWPGVAFTFPLQHAAWSEDKDFVSLLGSHLAGVATHMALFEGKSWPEARRDLFVREPTGPRMSALATRSKDSLPAEIDIAHILGDGRIELQRRKGCPSFTIVLNQTTPQDLITELGPPDATHKRDEPNGTPEPANQHRRTGSTSRAMSNTRAHQGSQPSSYSSTGTDTFDADFDSGEADEDLADRASRERFWCYFAHGLDILVGPPSEVSMGSPQPNYLSTSPHLVVTKVVLHGNIPGSYAFNRHRRLRWTLTLLDPPSRKAEDLTNPTHLTSDQPFDTHIKPALLAHFAPSHPGPQLNKGKIVNRTWTSAGAPGSESESSFFLPDEEVEVRSGGGEGGVGGVEASESWLGNTELFSFPGLIVEVAAGGGAVVGLGVF